MLLFFFANEKPFDAKLMFIGKKFALLPNGAF